MIKTLGPTHIATPVKDVKRSSLFYKKVFGAKEMYHDPDGCGIETWFENIPGALKTFN